MGVYAPNRKMPESCRECRQDFWMCPYIFEHQEYLNGADIQLLEHKRHEGCRLIEDDFIRRQDAIDAFCEESNGVKIKDAISIADTFLREHECDELWDAVRALRDCLECARDRIYESNIRR